MPSAGQPTLLDASGSSDRDDTITEYRWDFDGDGTIDQVTSTPQATTTFGAPGTVESSVTVVDARGQSASHALTMQVLPRSADAGVVTSVPGRRDDEAEAKPKPTTPRASA